MRRVSRLTLDATTVRKLRAKQGRANEKRAAGTLQVQREWDGLSGPLSQDKKRASLRW